MVNSTLFILLLHLFVGIEMPNETATSTMTKTNAAVIAAPDASEATNKQEVRILHIGDSHIQADLFTGEVRRLLREYLRDTMPQRGFVFPFSVAATNNPLDYKSTSTGSWTALKSTDVLAMDAFGINGIVLKTADRTATISFKLKNEKSRFNRVRILYTSTSGIKPRITGNFTVIKTFDNKDSAFIDFILDTKADSITMSLAGGTNGEFRVHGLLLEDMQSAFAYNVVGLNGASTTSFLRCDNLATQIKSINPTHVIISLGTNDAYSTAFAPQDLKVNLEKLIEKVRVAAPFATLVLTTPGDFMAKGRKTTPSPKIAAEIITTVAANTQCAVWDFFDQMGGEGSIEVWYHRGLASPDRLHLSKEGYKVQGRMFFEWLTAINS